MNEPSLQFEKTSNGYRLTAIQEVPLALEEVFPFFSDAHNLEKLTPPWVKFEMLTQPPIVMAEGLKIDYRLIIRRIPEFMFKRMSL